MNIKQIIGFILLAVSIALLVFVVLELNGTFVFTSPRSGYYTQPYSGHALRVLLAIAGMVVSFLAGLFLVGIGRKNR